MTLDLSIVMPCSNRRYALAATLDRLNDQTYPPERFEVIVVDQASTDGSRDVVRAEGRPYQLRLLEQDARYGISVARNGGAALATAPLILFLDADLLPDPGLVAAHVEFHASRQGALACGRVLPYRPAYLSFVEEVANPEAALDRGDIERALPFYDAFGGHLSLGAQGMAQIGPFDPALRGFEDIDFAYRATRLGFVPVNCVAAVAYHNHPRTLPERLAQARSYSRMLPILLLRYPELAGAMPPLCDLEAIDFRRDGLLRLLKKTEAGCFSTALLQKLGGSLLMALNRCHRAPRLAKALYWRLVRGQERRGFREGLAAVRNQVAGATDLRADSPIMTVSRR